MRIGQYDDRVLFWSQAFPARQVFPAQGDNTVARRQRFQRWLVLAGIAGIIALAGCGASDASRADARVPVVAAENFYGDLAQQIGGNSVSVTSVIASPDADPHLFEPGSRTGLAVAKAKVVIGNGAGYDDWMSRLLAAAPSSGRRVVTIADVLQVKGPDPNPHLWYDVPALPRVVTAIGEALISVDRRHAATYRLGMSHTLASLQPLQQAVAELRSRYSGQPVAYTERVPGLLLAAAGLQVRTPPRFAAAIEDGTDPTPADVAAMQSLLTEHRIRVLLYNQQATSALTERLRQLAATSGVPIVAVTETEPQGSTFVGWQLGQVNALNRALGA
jgi:zinc/manganese transport system substrate-binding protein